MPPSPDPKVSAPRWPSVPAWMETAAAKLRWPLWIGYGLSALIYVLRIADGLRAAREPGFVPALFGASGWTSEIFFLVGTAHWVTAGINRIASPPRAAASMALAGLHILLFAVRVWLAPVLSVMDAVGR